MSSYDIVEGNCPNCLSEISVQLKWAEDCNLRRFTLGEEAPIELEDGIYGLVGDKNGLNCGCRASLLVVIKDQKLVSFILSEDVHDPLDESLIRLVDENTRFVLDGCPTEVRKIILPSIISWRHIPQMIAKIGEL